MISITNFYRFVPLPDSRRDEFAAELLAYGKPRGLLGLTIVAHEGCNGTVCGPKEEVELFEKELVRMLNTEVTFKRSETEVAPFRWFQVKVRAEIVTSGESINVDEGRNSLTPAQWNEVLQSGEPISLVDARNFYEIEIGKFRGAIDPGMRSFRRLREHLEQLDLPKDRKVLTYCTGGVRCEKAIAVFEEMGFNEVYHLRGGILTYLEEFPHGEFEGECFVFDDRVAVTSDLKPTTQYLFCKRCGGAIPIGTESCKRCEHDKEKILREKMIREGENGLLAREE